MPTIDTDVEAVFQKVFSKPELHVTRAMNTFDIPGWSSLLHVRVIVALEERFHVEFSPEEIVKAKNVGDLIALIEGKAKKEG